MGGLGFCLGVLGGFWFGWFGFLFGRAWKVYLGGETVESWEWLLMTAALIVGIGLILILGVIDE